MKQGGFTGLSSALNATPNASTTACLYYPGTNSYVSALYYDGTGGSESTTQGSSVLKVTAVAASDKWTTDTPAKVAQDALLSVDISVTQLGANKVIYRTGTYLVRSGI